MVSRRKFLTGAATSALVASCSRHTAAEPQQRGTRSLVPEEAGRAPNYWCTWAIQNYMYGQGQATVDPTALEGDSGSKLAHEILSERVLFGGGGWADRLYPQVRADLYLLLDDGWEAGGTATFELDQSKFPSFPGDPSQRLAGLNRAIKKRNWRGTALWCRNTPGGQADHYLEERSRAAEIDYWKIDIGDPSFHLISVRDQMKAPLTLEHVHGELPVNGDWKKDGRFGEQPWGSRRQQILANTDVYRTYDVTSILSVPTTLDRLAEMLRGAQGHAQIHGLLNVEDEVYLAAAMGCTMGVMRHPLVGLRPGQDLDLFFNGPRQTKRRMDEVVRALRWQRIAPPFSPGVGSVSVSDDVLTDSWRFERGQTWQTDLVGQLVHQGAPASITRNLPLPEIRGGRELPFVVGARFPNGAVAVAAHERTSPEDAWHMPACRVTFDAGDATGPFGVFGEFPELTFVLGRRIEGKRIVAQDLMADRARDITGEVQMRGNRLTLSDKVIHRVGREAATTGDLSAPGLVLAIV